MPKRKTPEEKPKDQFKRFVETAKEREVREDAAETAFETLARKKKTSSSEQK